MRAAGAEFLLQLKPSSTEQDFAGASEVATNTFRLRVGGNLRKCVDGPCARPIAKAYTVAQRDDVSRVLEHLRATTRPRQNRFACRPAVGQRVVDHDGICCELIIGDTIFLNFVAGQEPSRVILTGYPHGRRGQPRLGWRLVFATSQLQRCVVVRQPSISRGPRSAPRRLLVGSSRWDSALLEPTS